MKKHFFVLTTVLVNFYLTSCNSGDSSTSNTSDSPQTTHAAAQPDPCEGIDEIDLCKDARGIFNLIINEQEATKMMTDFRKYYKKQDDGNDIKALDDFYWVDACTIFAIEKYLTTEKDPSTGKLKYDGLRIYLGCEENDDQGTYPGQQYKRKSTLFFFPTKTRVPHDPNKSDHADVGVKIPTDVSCISPYLQEYATASRKIEAFNTIYRRMQMPPPQQKDAFSKAIWIDACVISTVTKLLKLPNAKLDGVNINMAAYNTLDRTTRPSQLYINQSTAIIVPTSLKDGKHENNWKIVDCLFKHFKLLGWEPGGFNHGELCPQKCE